MWKKMRKQIMALTLSALMVLGFVSVQPVEANEPEGKVPAEETSSVDYSKTQSDAVSYNGYECDEATGVYTFHYEIQEGAGENLVIDLSKCAQDMWENETQMPGDHFKFQVLIQNNSGNTYRYKDDSFVLAPGDTSEMGSLEDGTLLPILTYDGQYMPVKAAGAMIPYYFYKDVFGVEKSADVTFEMMCQIYDYLEKAGYTGETAITDYMLDYYNAKRNTEYTTLQDLFADHPDWLDGNLLTVNGIWSMSEGQLKEYIAKYPWIEKFVYTTTSGSGVKVQIKWPEPELAAVSYNSFYQGLFSAVYGKDNVDALNPNGSGVEFSRAHGIGDYMAGTELYEETNEYFHNLTKEPLKSEETLEVWTGYGIDGPGMGNSYQNYSFTYYNIIELEQVKPIQANLADITIYTGGNGYEGVVGGVTGDGTSNNGFPTPGFYITLPDELNEKLGSIQDLSDYMTLKYDDGNGNTRKWELELYGTPSHSSDEGGYIYKFNTTAEGQDPVRVQLTDEDGTYIVSDEFDASVEEQYKEYDMSIYAGSLKEEYVTAEFIVGGRTYVYPVEQGESATLTVKANINEIYADIYTDREQITTKGFAAVADENVTYYVNDKNVQVKDTSGVRLMVDDLLDDGVLVNYIEASDAFTRPKGKVVYEQKYMDLVDTNNGDVYLNLGEGEKITVYWPVPDGYTKGGEAFIYHFAGLDRHYNDGDVVGHIDKVETIRPELVTVNGNDYFEFSTSGFSPFVLAYGNGAEDGTDKPDAGNGKISSTPKTGDGSAAAVWAAAMFVAAGTVFFYRKRKSFRQFRK